VRFLYYPAYRDRDFAFSFLLFSTLVFIVVFFLKDANISLGFTFGLFAVFAILRYRTETISTKEMTYLFIVIGLAMLNAVGQLNLLELSLINLLVLAITYFAQSQFFLKPEYRKTILYEKVELLRPERQGELVRDLEQRLGLKVHRIEIRNIDFVRDNANIRVYYAPETSHAETALGENYETVRESP
jgi:ABC-type antimicrobial peptide transport system permease subunit